MRRTRRVLRWLPEAWRIHGSCSVPELQKLESNPYYIDALKPQDDQMANVNVRNLPDEVHRAIRIQAAQHGRSTEAEIRSILERAAKPEGRVKLGSFLAAIAREAGGLTDEEHALLESGRIKSPARAANFE